MVKAYFYVYIQHFECHIFHFNTQYCRDDLLVFYDDEKKKKKKVKNISSSLVNILFSLFFF